MRIKFGKKIIGEDKPTLIVAELSANHLQKFDLAVKTIEAMKKSGADVVKLQTYTPDTLTINSNNKYFTINQGTIWDGQNFYKLYKEAYMPWDWQPKLQKIAHSLGMEFFSAVADETSVDFLNKMKVPAFKLPSFEIVDIPLIEYAASKKKSMIIPTGVATLSDIEAAVNACKRQGNDQIALLLCSSSYPAPLEEMNLKTLPNMAQTFNTVVGLSDHTMGLTVPVAAVALGAKIVEKHFILDRKLGGSDSAFSMEPNEFKEMVKAIRDTEKALGRISYEMTAKKKKNRELSPSLFVSKDMKKNETFSANNITSVRPGFGLPPKYINQILGRKARVAIKKATPLSWDIVS